MILLLLIVVQFLTGIVSFFSKSDKGAKCWALLSSVVTFVIALAGVYSKGSVNYTTTWLPELGSNFSLTLDGMSKMLALLTAIAFPLVFASTWKNGYKRPFSFYGLLLFMQAGLLGVFLASDLLLFYFFWELA